MNFIESLMKQDWITTKSKSGFKIEEQKKEEVPRNYMTVEYES